MLPTILEDQQQDELERQKKLRSLTIKETN